MFRLLAVGFFPLTVFAQPKPFTPNAKVGEPVVVGVDYLVHGSKERVATGTTAEVTVESVELALVFPNRTENVFAAKDEKLLIIRGSVKNPETAELKLGPSYVIGIRLWERYTGSGKFTFVRHHDPETLKSIDKGLKKGESARFVGVWKVPADWTDYRLGVTHNRPLKIGWYDFRPVIKPVPPPVGTALEVDGLELRFGPATDPAMFAGYARDPAKPRYVVSVTAKNRMLLPVRWGWQYFSVELIGADGTAVKAYNDILDQATGRSWSGDLEPGATMNGWFQFYPSAPMKARKLRFTVNETGRSVEAEAGASGFFRRGDYNWLVGIYTGDGQFIRSPNRRELIEVPSLDAHYYEKRYLGARRLTRRYTAAPPPGLSCD